MGKQCRDCNSRRSRFDDRCFYVFPVLGSHRAEICRHFRCDSKGTLDAAARGIVTATGALTDIAQFAEPAAWLHMPMRWTLAFISIPKDLHF